MVRQKAYKVNTEHESQSREILVENNDCTVRAYAAALNLSYAESHAILKIHGRKNRRGFHLNSFLKKMHPEIKAFLPRQTVYSFINGYGRKGTWIVWIRRHVFTIIDGVAIDKGMFPAGSRIIAVWKFDAGHWYCGKVQCKSEYEAIVLSEVLGKPVEYR